VGQAWGAEVGRVGAGQQLDAGGAEPPDRPQSVGQAGIPAEPAAQVVAPRGVQARGHPQIGGIDRWFGAIVANGTRQDAVGGCAIGSLAAQLSDQDDLTRVAFVDAFARWEAPLIAGLRRMQESGELLPDVDVTEPADLTMAAIQGGLLLTQIRRKPDQLRLALWGARAALEDALTQTVHSGRPAGKRRRGAETG
jgi:tetracycline repressor-like protein